MNNEAGHLGLPCVACYLDDTITGQNESAHLDNLSRVLERLQEFGFTFKKDFQRFSPCRRMPNLRAVFFSWHGAALQEILTSLSGVCAPLNDLLKKGKEIKKMLTSARALTHYDLTKPIFLTVDASSKGRGAAIYCHMNG